MGELGFHRNNKYSLFIHRQAVFVARTLRPLPGDDGIFNFSAIYSRIE